MIGIDIDQMTAFGKRMRHALDADRRPTRAWERTSGDKCNFPYGLAPTHRRMLEPLN